MVEIIVRSHGDAWPIIWPFAILIVLCSVLLLAIMVVNRVREYGERRFEDGRMHGQLEELLTANA